MKVLIVLGLIALLPNSEQEIASGKFHHSRHRYTLKIKRNNRFEMQAGDCTWGFQAKGDYYIQNDTIYFAPYTLKSRNKVDSDSETVRYFKWFSKAVYISPDKILQLTRVADVHDNVLYIAKDTLSIN